MTYKTKKELEEDISWKMFKDREFSNDRTYLNMENYFQFYVERALRSEDAEQYLDMLDFDEDDEYYPSESLDLTLLHHLFDNDDDRFYPIFPRNRNNDDEEKDLHYGDLHYKNLKISPNFEEEQYSLLKEMLRERHYVRRNKRILL